MHIKSIVAGAAIALAATVGSASAADLKTMAGIQADPLSAFEMGMVRARKITVDVTVPDPGVAVTGISLTGFDGFLKVDPTITAATPAAGPGPAPTSATPASFTGP